MTGVGKVPVKQPRVRDKRSPTQREFFTPAVLPKYLRKTKSMEELIPWLYLKGISTNDFPEALQALLGTDAKGLLFSSPWCFTPKCPKCSVIVRRSGPGRSLLVN
jgi:transposase-like protein